MPRSLSETLANFFRRTPPAFAKRFHTPPAGFFVGKSSFSSCRALQRAGRVPLPPSDWTLRSLEFLRITRTPRNIETMKRSATTSVVTASKKRKTDAGPKFYAVKAGFRPGVYTTYAECSAQTAGFKGAVCKTTDGWLYCYGNYILTR